MLILLCGPLHPLPKTFTYEKIPERDLKPPPLGFFSSPAIISHHLPHFSLWSRSIISLIEWEIGPGNYWKSTSVKGSNLILLPKIDPEIVNCAVTPRLTEIVYSDA